jgi:hypothetical protein
MESSKCLDEQVYFIIQNMKGWANVKIKIKIKVDCFNKTKKCEITRK